MIGPSEAAHVTKDRRPSLTCVQILSGCIRKLLAEGLLHSAAPVQSGWSVVEVTAPASFQTLPCCAALL